MKNNIVKLISVSILTAFLLCGCTHGKYRNKWIGSYSHKSTEFITYEVSDKKQTSANSHSEDQIAFDEIILESGGELNSQFFRADETEEFEVEAPPLQIEIMMDYVEDSNLIFYFSDAYQIIKIDRDGFFSLLDKKRRVHTGYFYGDNTFFLFRPEIDPVTKKRFCAVFRYEKDL